MTSLLLPKSTVAVGNHACIQSKSVPYSICLTKEQSCCLLLFQKLEVKAAKIIYVLIVYFLSLMDNEIITYFQSRIKVKPNYLCTGLYLIVDVNKTI